jgi:citrate lyase beta subunit
MSARRQRPPRPSASPPRLARANRELATQYPGDGVDRQPVHTVYGGAHLFSARTCRKFGALALAALDECAPDGTTLARALGIEGPPAFGDLIRARIVEKLTHEPVEDLRIDFEDGYGNRPDAEEDGHARSVAEEMARGAREGTLPWSIGIRIKPLSNESAGRSLRTLDLFVTTLARSMGRQVPANFVITIPKVMVPDHVSTVVRACAGLERRARLRPGSLRIDLMVETPQAIVSPDGSTPLRRLVAAGLGRVVGVHFGAYDYTSACGITAAHQRLQHPACDFARHMMQAALAQSGVYLSDGGTNVLPIAPHRPRDGAPLTARQRTENRAIVHRAWKVHYDAVRHALVGGFYRGWDLHPTQLVSRFAAVYAFFLAARPAATARLRAFVDKAAQATRVGNVFDDEATGQGLLNFFNRAVGSGALTMEEAAETGLTRDELQGRSFARIVRARGRT